MKELWNNKEDRARESKKVLREVFGTLKGWKINAQKMKDELRISEKVELLERMYEITKKSKLTQKDVDEIAKKIDGAAARKFKLKTINKA